MRIVLIAILFFAMVDAVFASFIPKSFEAQMEQVVHLLTKNKQSVTAVNMKYLFPNNIYFNVKSVDTPVIYVCNPKTTWKYNPPFDPELEKGEVLIGDSSKYCYVKLFDALSNGLKENKIYKVKKDKKTAHLIFEKEAQLQTKITRVNLSFKNEIKSDSSLEDVSQMEVFYQDKKQPVVFRFKSLNTKAQITSKDFDFQVPVNTNISHF